MPLFRSKLPKPHLILMIALGLAGCGGGSGTGTSTSPTVIAGSPTATPTPTPTPEATSSPAASPTSVAAPALDGIARVASGINVADYLTPSWGTGAIPGLEDLNIQGAFRFICTPSHNAYNDPIVFPGQPGRSHLHTFFGNTKADAYSTYQSLRTTGDSTCNNMLNRSAYWIPAMMNGHGKVVMPDYVAIYYKRAPAGARACTFAPVKACLSLPRGLRYIFGYNMADPANGAPEWAQYWNCDGVGAVPGFYKNLRAAAANCPRGARVGAVIIGPPCWNGKDLDSADHRSHMAYPQQDGYGNSVCPSTHPYILPFFQLAAWYTNDGTIDDWYLSSDRMPGMAEQVPGTTLHTDWFGAWEDSTLALWMDNCINKSLSCNGGDLGNGNQMSMVHGYNYGNVTTLVDPPAL